MNKYIVLYSPSFYEKLEKIENYYTFDFKNASLFQNLFKEVEKCILNLEDNPRAFALFMNYRKKEVYRYTMKNHIIFYTIEEERKEVVLINIYHHLEDYLSYYG